jgi:hypothetical protein
MKMTLRTGEFSPKRHCYPTQLPTNTGHCPVPGHKWTQGYSFAPFSLSNLASSTCSLVSA